MSDRRSTLLFAKRPEPGRVKTRLTPHLAPGRAADLAEAMLLDAAERLAASSAFHTTLWFAPAEAGDWFRSRLPALADQRAQVGSGLGERLAHAFAEALSDEGTTSCVALGSDQPLLTTAKLAAAHAALEVGADLVLAPDPGGGYALIGLRCALPALFLEVEMSSAGMAAATLALARRHGLECRVLDEELDVDEAADLERLRTALAALRAAPHGPGPDFPKRTARFLDAFPAGADALRGRQVQR